MIIKELRELDPMRAPKPYDPAAQTGIKPHVLTGFTQGFSCPEPAWARWILPVVAGVIWVCGVFYLLWEGF